MMENINPRYKAYLKTTDKPTNWGFMGFISDMVTAYGKARNLEKPDVGNYRILDHDDFTAFIEERVGRIPF